MAILPWSTNKTSLGFPKIRTVHMILPLNPGTSFNHCMHTSLCILSLIHYVFEYRPHQSADGQVHQGSITVNVYDPLCSNSLQPQPHSSLRYLSYIPYVCFYKYISH